MTGLFDSLSIASQALLAQRLGLDVVGHNLANVNTPGYARRMLVLAETPPADGWSAGRGVSVVEIRALRDALLDARVRRETGAMAAESAVAELLATAEVWMGLPGASLDQALSRFFDAWSALASDPAGLTGRDIVVREGRALAGAFRELSSRIEATQTDADRAIRSAVADLNRLTSEIAALNVAISAGGPGVNTLRDQQTERLAALGRLTDVAVRAREDGMVDVALTSGRALVMGERAYTLAVSPNGLASIDLDGVGVTGDLTGGRIAGLLHVRDVLAPRYLAEIDQLAWDLAASVDSAHGVGIDAAGAAAGAFFVPRSGVAGAARSLEVDPQIVADAQRVAAGQSGTAGDNTVARQIAALRQTPVGANGRSALETWGRILFTVGADLDAARASERNHQDVVRQLQALQAQVSGVSYDEEAAYLMRYQRAYEANARYFQTIVDTIDVLMRMVR